MLKLLKEAWGITKKYKFLWIFGLFSPYLVPFYFPYFPKENLFKISYFPLIPENLYSHIYLYNLANIAPFSPSQDISLFIFVLFFIIIFLLFIFLSIFSLTEIGLIWATNKIRKGEEINFNITFKNSFKYFWKVFLFNLFVLICYYLVSIPAYLLLLRKNFGGLIINWVIVVLFYLVFYLVFSIYLTVFLILGLREIVINETSLINGIKTTHQLIIANLKEILKFFIINIVLQIILSFLLFLLIFLLMFLSLVMIIKNSTTWAIIGLLFFFISFIIWIILKSMGSTLISSWMTLVYLDYFKKENKPETDK